MRSKTLLVGVIGVVIGVLLAAAGIVVAGSLNPGAGPTEAGSQMYTLQQIYNRLNTGTAGIKMTAFTEPSSGPTTGTGRTLDEIMAKAPALDATNGAGVADVAGGKTFWGLTAGAWGLQTGTASGGGGTCNAGVPKTGAGAITDYTLVAGEDGLLQKGVAWPNPRFTDNGNGTVTDNLTGLIWLKSANCCGMTDWAGALSAANTLNSGECGLTDGSVEGDWRLPSLREQHSLIHFGYHAPALPNTAGTAKWAEGDPFTGVNDIQSRNYWTSTTSASDSYQAWIVDLYDGKAASKFKIDFFYLNKVWPIRGGQ